MVSTGLNYALYDETLRKAHSYAWEGKWDKALEEYRRAASLNPDAPDPYVGIGGVYAQLGRWDEAIEAYRKASEVEPYDLAIKEQLANALAKAGKKKEAAETYMDIASLYWQRKQVRKTIESLTKAVKLAPHLPEPYLQLARVYEHIGENILASKAYTNLASIYKDQGQRDQALNYCNLALKLDPNNTKAKTLQTALQYGEQLLPLLEEVEEIHEASPVEVTRQQALSQLAEIIFEGPVTPTGRRVDTLLGQALDAQSRGDVDEAIANYRQVLEAGLDIPAVHFHLGLLYKEKLMLDEAIRHLSIAVEHPQYALGSHFALGECYKISGQVDKALKHFLEALKIVDLSTLGHTQADELIKLYRSLADSLLARGDRERALSFIQSLMDFFSAKGWEDKVKELRKHIRAFEDEGIALSLAEIMEAPHPEEVLRSLSLSQELMRRKLLDSASEECLRGISDAPFCLPLHIQLAEIMIKDGHIEEGVEKYLLIAQDYELRGIPYRSVNILKRLIRLIPMDVNIRARLINTLVSCGQIDEAIEQYIQMGELFYELADIKRAIEGYRQALLLAPRSSDEKGWRRKILPKLGDLYAQIMRWPEALQAYEELKELEPDNRELRKNLIILYGRLNRHREEIRELEELLREFKRQNKLTEAVEFLEELVKEQPQSQALHSILARLYLERGMKDKAVEQLDALGELQLEAGKIEEAKETIRTIISLAPKEAAAYQMLLERLESGIKV